MIWNNMERRDGRHGADFVTKCEHIVDSGLINQVDVWHLSTEMVSQQDLTEWTRTLSDDERARAERFVWKEDRRDYIAAHALTRAALSRHRAVAPPDWRFEANSNGKPTVVASQSGAPPLTFSLSHTRGLVACAVAQAAHIGIDVERVDRAVAAQAIAESSFSPAEIQMLGQSSHEDYASRFIELWTLKEACLKAEGSGLAGGLDSYAFAFNGSSSLCMVSPHAGWHFFLAAVASIGKLALAHRAENVAGLRLVIHAHSDGEMGALKPLRWTDGVSWTSACDSCLTRPAAAV